MGKNAKLGIAGGVVLLLALIARSVLNSTGLALALIVLGGLGIAALYQRLPDDEGGGGGEPGVKRKKQLQGKKRLDALLEGGTNESKTQAKARPKTPPAAGGLPTWGGGLETDDDIEVVEDEPATDWDTWDSEWNDTDGATATAEAEADADAEEIDLANPLDNLDRLDDIDPIAEVERLDALDEEVELETLDELDTLTDFDTITELDTEDSFEIEELVDLDEPEPAAEEPAPSGGAFSFSAGPAAPVINEHVETADDIMAASQATELGEEAADSELAKLLAKVQARLAAYE